MGVLDRFRLDGKRAFVTGGSRGLGREMALGLAEAGANLVLVGREQTALDQRPPSPGAGGGLHDQADVGQPASRARAGRRSPVDILISNVGRRVDIPTQCPWRPGNAHRSIPSS
jgi:gluconate 5-dehydrogenase